MSMKLFKNIQSNWDDLGDEKQEKVKKISVNTVGIAIVLASFGLMFWGYNYSNAISDKIATNTKEIKLLQSDITKNKMEKKLDANEIKEDYKNAIDIGNAVSELQNKYIKAVGDSNFKSDSVGKKLSGYFGDTTDDQMGRVPWFMPNNPGINDFSWQFMSDYNFTGDGVDCVWICFDKEGRIVAYTKSYFDSNTKKFKVPVTKKTEQGLTNFKPEDEGRNSEKKKQFDDLLKKLKTYEDANTKQAPVDEKSRDAQDLNRQKMMEEQKNKRK